MNIIKYSIVLPINVDSICLLLFSIEFVYFPEYACIQVFSREEEVLARKHIYIYIYIYIIFILYTFFIKHR